MNTLVNVLQIVTPAADTLNSALSSFYSEMATITSSTSTVTSDGVQPEVNEGKLVDNATDKAKKKKKTKVSVKIVKETYCTLILFR